MNSRTDFKTERIIAVMMILESLCILFPWFFPTGFDRIVLSCLLLISILYWLHQAELGLKRKYN